ncbi:MAG: RDD family protein [Flavobacteriales bacterium]|nr:RDD family protein [Flavobacteriales bacterium]
MLKAIDIRTTQNVTISYELAYLRERILAFLLDFIFIAVGILVLMFIFNLVSFFDDWDSGWKYFQYLIILPIRSFYTLFFESVCHGQTPGKMILRIKVVKLDGKQPQFFDYLMRWTFRLIDVWMSFGILGSLLIVSTDHGQRLGDIVSNCTVVRVQSRLVIGLNDIMKIDTRSNYTPVYQGIRHFREEDILIIKQTIERYNQFRNESHRSAVLELCTVMKEKLNIENLPQNKIEFLKTLIKDYIVLTR